MRQFLFIVLLVSLFSIANAQENSLNVTVTDSIGAVVPKAKVLIQSQDSNTFAAKEGLTNYSGEFVFNNLPFGRYKILATHSELGGNEKIIFVAPQKPNQKAVNISLKLYFDCEKNSKSKITLSDAEKSEILKTTLREAFEGKNGILTKEQRFQIIIISNKNIKAKWFEGFYEITFKLLSPKKIQQKADNEADFLYVQFDRFEIKGNCVLVSISNTWAVGKHSDSIYLDGSGRSYLLQKDSGKWKIIRSSGWVS